MSKVYTACMLVDEKELEVMLDSVGAELHRYSYVDEPFNELAKLYVKLLKEKEDIQRERAKHEPETESI